MQLTIAEEGSVVVLRPSGKLTIGESETLMNETVIRLVDEGRVHLLIDLEGVTAMDSSGVDSLIRAWRLTQERGGAMKLVNVGTRIQTLLELTGLTSVWEIYTDPQLAISRFARA